MTNGHMKSRKKRSLDTKNMRYPEQATKLVYLRGDKTQKAFAVELGLQLRAYQRYENGERKMAGGLIRLAEIINGHDDLYNKDSAEAIPPDVAALLDKARRVLMGKDPIAREALEKNIVYFASKLEDEKRAQPSMEDRLARLEETCEEIVGEVKAIKRTVNKTSSEGSGGGDIGGSFGSVAA